MILRLRYQPARVDVVPGFFLGGADEMGRTSKDLGGDARGGGAEPPCMAAGDDRNGPEHPPWVQPGSDRGSQGFLAARDPDFKRQWPTLSDFLTLTGWSGKQRKSGTLLLFAEEGKWKACVNDRDGGYYAFLSSESFLGLLGALEDSLKGGGLDWRQSRSGRK